jgi:aryl-alcohol dehydrogenase-like predicted oxidoreductase
MAEISSDLSHHPGLRQVHLAAGTIPVSAFGFGTIGWGTQVRGDHLDRLYDTYRAAGGNFLDSAHVYAFWLPEGLGASERALGEIVRRRNDRRNVLLVTKGGHPNLSGYPRPDYFLAPDVISQDITESLERLGFDAIDLYFLHRDDPRVPVGELIDLLNEHLMKGHVRALGASNWTTSRIAAANEYAAAHGKKGFAASQPRFSLAVPNASGDPTVKPFDSQDYDWHCATGFPMCAYSPTANGYFATNGTKGAKGWTNPTTLARLRAAQRLAAEVGVTPNQIALAYLLHQPFPVVPVLGTTNLEHLVESLAAKDVQLSMDQIHHLRDAINVATSNISIPSVAKVPAGIPASTIDRRAPSDDGALSDQAK